MKKFYLFLLALVAFTLTANAATRIIYLQNFETSSSVPSDWGSPSAADGLSISSDEYGKFLKFAPSGNDRSCYLYFGGETVENSGATQYSMSFDFSANAWGNNHQTTELAVVSCAESMLSGKSANTNFRGVSSDWLFDLSQLNADNGGNALSASGDQVFVVNGDSANTVTLTAGAFYTVELTIDVDARTVDYSLLSTTGANVASGTYEVPEGVSMNVSGISFLGARYTPVQYFDNIKVWYESDDDYANAPTVTMTGINNQQRVYHIGFVEGETLHYTFNGGTEETVQYDDCDGDFVWSNNPNYDPENEGLVTDECEGGELKAWTTCGSATSEKVTEQIENDIVSLPATTVKIVNVEAGYSKTYQITADNSAVPLRPQLYISYVFTPEGGGTQTVGSDLSSGSEITIPSKGTIEFTTSAFGYGASNNTVENNIKYHQSAEYNFAHWTDAEITAAGYAVEAEPLNNKYSSCGRYYGLTEDEAKVVYSTIPYFTKKSSEWADSVIVGPVVFAATPSVNVFIYKGIGLVLNGQKGDDGAGSWISSLYIKVNDVKDDDIIMFAQTGDYGKTSLHPTVADLDEYLASDNAPITDVITGADLKSGTGFGLYRISNALHFIRVMSAGESTGIKDIAADVADKANADAPVYTLSGMRVNGKNLSAGVYIQNGKKFVVK